MMQQPPTGGGGGAVHPSTMDQQQQPPPPQPQPTTSTAAQEEEEEELFRTLWMGEWQNWMDKVEGKEIRTLWIGDLQHWMDEAYIDSCFSDTREVFTSKVIRNKKTGESECYGFIEFKSHATAKRFLQKFNGTVGTNFFSLDWAGEKKQQRQEEEDDDDDDDDDDDGDLAAAASDIVTTDFMLPQEEEDDDDDGDIVVASNEVVENSSWEDMLKWWSIAQGSPTPEAVRATLKVYGIGAFLKRPYRNLERIGPPPTEVEGYLDELTQLDESIDIAKELHSIDALHPLIGELCSPHDGIRARAAKIINIMAKKHPSSRHLVMEANGETLLYHTYIGDHNPTVQTNALDAMSSLFLDDGHGISAFGQEGYADLIGTLKYTNENCQRKALNLIARLVKEHKSDCNIVTASELPSIMMHLASSLDADVRVAALKCLTVLAEVEKCGNSGPPVIVNNNELEQVLQERMEAFTLPMDPEDLGAASYEKQLLESLWNVCYNNKPSFLLEKGLLM